MGEDILYIVMPAYNEEETIGSVVRSWYPVLENADPASRLIVDISGSTDATGDILKKMRRDCPKLRILDGGLAAHGPKLIRMYRASCRAGADYIFQTDSDGQTDAAEFAAFWEDRGEHPLQLGNRKVRGDGTDRKMVESVLCLLLRIIFGVRVPDANAPFRLMRTDLVKKYIGRLPKNYSLPNVMLTVFFSYYGEALSFKEITFAPRQGGENSIDLKKIFLIGLRSLREFAQFRLRM